MGHVGGLRPRTPARGHCPLDPIRRTEFSLISKQCAPVDKGTEYLWCTLRKHPKIPAAKASFLRPGFSSSFSRIPEGKPGEGRRKTARGSLLTSGDLTYGFVAYTKAIPFSTEQAHIVNISVKLCSPGGVKGTNKEETRRVSDAANDKTESGEALPERSDRECDETEVPGAEAPDVPYAGDDGPQRNPLSAFQISGRSAAPASVRAFSASVRSSATVTRFGRQITCWSSFLCRQFSVFTSPCAMQSWFGQVADSI